MQVVDIIMMETLSDLQSEDVDENPLIKLGCGHVWTVETLDGSIHMAEKWVGIGVLSGHPRSQHPYGLHVSHPLHDVIRKRCSHL